MKKKWLAAVLAAGLMGTTVMPAAAEEAGRASILEEKYGITMMSEAMEQGAFAMDMSFAMDMGGEQMRYDYSVASDSAAQQMKYAMNLQNPMSPSDNAWVEMYMDAEKAQMRMSEFPGADALQISYGSGLASDLLSSPFLAAMGVSLNGSQADSVEKAVQDLIPLLFAMPKKSEEPGENFVDMLSRINQERTLVAVSEQPAKDYTINGQMVSCKGYSVNMSGQAMWEFGTALLAEAMDKLPMDTVNVIAADVLNVVKAFMPNSEVGMFSAEQVTLMVQQVKAMLGNGAMMSTLIQQIMADKNMSAGFDNVNIVTYLTPEGKIADLSVTFEMEMGDGHSVQTETMLVNLNLQMLGDAMNLTLNMTVDGETLSMILTSKEMEDGTKYIEDVNMTMLVPGEDAVTMALREVIDTADNSIRGDGNISSQGETIPVSMRGTITQQQKGGYMNISLDQIMLTSPDGTETITMSGSYGFGPLESPITELEGNKVDLLTADMATLEAFFDGGQPAASGAEGFVGGLNP